MNFVFGIILGVVVTVVTGQRHVGEGYKFECATSNNEMDFLTLFDKLKFITIANKSEVLKYDSVRKLTEKTDSTIQRFSEFYDQEAFKNLEKFLCENMHIDLKFIFENFMAFHKYLSEEFKSKKPQEIPDDENFGNFEEMMSEVLFTYDNNKKLQDILVAQVKDDPKLADGMKVTRTPEFLNLITEVFKLPLFEELVKNVADTGIDETYETYALWFGATYWDRSNDSGADSLKGLNHFIFLGASVLLCSQNFFMKLF